VKAKALVEKFRHQTKHCRDHALVVVLVDRLAEVKPDKFGDTLADVLAGAPVQKLAATLEVVVSETVNDKLTEVEAGTIIDSLARRGEGRNT